MNPIFSECINLKQNRLFPKLWLSGSAPGIQYFNKDKVPYDPWPSYRYSGPLRPWPKTMANTVPESIPRPDYAVHPQHISLSEESGPMSRKITVLNDCEIMKMRKVCSLAREVMDEAAKAIKIGASGEDIDRVVHEASISRSCYPSPLHYYNFPNSVCVSVNEVICHGIPDSRPLQDGDIVKVDITVFYEGFHGDLNETFIVGTVDETAIKLIKVTHECLMKAIAIVKPGVPYNQIGTIIQEHADKNNFTVVKNYTGHGIHRLFHALPTVYHFKNNKNLGIMQPGHTFTIEPMINEGLEKTKEWPDNWTVVTSDGKRSAQFEQTLLVTADGCEILTARKDSPTRPYLLDQIKDS